MKDLLRNSLEQSGNLSFQDMILHILVAALLSVVIYVPLCLYA